MFHGRFHAELAEIAEQEKAEPDGKSFRLCDLCELCVKSSSRRSCLGVSVDQLTDQHSTRPAGGTGAADLRHFINIRYSVLGNRRHDSFFRYTKTSTYQCLLTLKFLNSMSAICGHRRAQRLENDAGALNTILRKASVQIITYNVHQFRVVKAMKIDNCLPAQPPA